jgi:GNAT superfamily N-acetyltransferase
VTGVSNIDSLSSRTARLLGTRANFGQQRAPAPVSRTEIVPVANLAARAVNLLKTAAAHPHAGRPGKVGGSVAEKHGLVPAKGILGKLGYHHSSDPAVRVSAQVDKDAVFVTRLDAVEQGKGHGSAALKRIQNFAAETGRRVELTAGADSPELQERLNRFYEKHGFTKKEGGQHPGYVWHPAKATLFERTLNLLKAAEHPHAGRPGQVGGSAPGRAVPIPHFSSRRVSDLRVDKTAWLAGGGDHDKGHAIVSKYYKAGAYAKLVTKGHVLVPMPSTSGRNILPHALADRISADHGAPVFTEHPATATAVKEAKHKSGYFAKLADPVGYQAEPAAMRRLKELNRPVIITEDVHNTGESWLAFKRTLEAHGITVAGVAALTSTETRMTSPRDMERLAGKVAKATGLPLDKATASVQSLFSGTFKQLFNKAEAAITRQPADAQRLIDIAAGHRRASDEAPGRGAGSDEQVLGVIQKPEPGLILQASTVSFDTSSHDAARDAAQSIYEQAALHAVHLKKERSKKATIDAVLLLLLLAGEDAFVETTKILDKQWGKETRLEAERFAAARQPVLKNFAAEFSAKLSAAREAADTSGLDAAVTLRKLRETAKEAGKTMAATEAQVTYGTVQLDRLQRAGYKTVRWHTMEDEKVRPTHLACEAQGEVKIGEAFSNGLKYPGDPAGPAEEVCNCRCYLVGGRR